MNRFLRFYLLYCCFNLIEIIVYTIYAKILIKYYLNLGVKTPGSVIYGITGFFFGNFVSFTAFSYAFLALNHKALLLYLYFTVFIFLYSALLLPYSVKPYLVLGFLLPLVGEYFFVLKNFDLYARKIIFQRNKKLGSNLKLKRALNVSENIIR
ncbi:hypothetical protein TUBRATIS_19960 [Tubulinosema ratisbonensis]|uniref:Uncharacterized protein n=1 Tax=Tubulinosema ratisbonensis TaxID=291195 RepID=A0A437AKD5_9MICR|nr:hypothetical protein TUBRATIS_19960 [Tubulinosema ratisbonensis]